ncbi:sensor histidine kinase [Photobacterium damselae]|uniref:sensor histidine kinase n=1 Tax=Photobacterium damselae TaxID=38293 RepID=UPI003B66CD75
MKIKSAKQLTFTYFSIVAFAIIAIHFSIFESTIEDLEMFNAQNRLDMALESVQQNLPQDELEHNNPYTSFYFGKANIPSDIHLPENLPFNKAVEVYKPSQDELETEYFVMRSKVTYQGKEQEVYIFNIDPIFERSEEQMMDSQSYQMLLTLGLLLVSLFAVLRISVRLTSPLSSLSKQLQNRAHNDFTPIQLPSSGQTRELVQLVESLNDYQQQITDLLERERAFNRFASHELRTPLMVIKGGLTLLGHSQQPEFVERQRNRMLPAVDEMQEYVQTLLSLTRDEQLTETPWQIREDLIDSLVSSYQQLLDGKTVKIDVVANGEPTVNAPLPAVKILLGNLIKNAFTYTEQGRITIILNTSNVVISDTGVGIDPDAENGQKGYGLGLLIVKDICRKYNWSVELSHNKANGCDATVDFIN